jgi:elongation factor G
VGALLLPDDAPLVCTGQTLTVGKGLAVTFESVRVPTPVIAVSLEAADAQEDGRMRQLLAQLVHDDPSLTVLHDHDAGQTLLAGMGELHLELALERLQRDEGLDCRVGHPRPRTRAMLLRGAEGAGSSVHEGVPRGAVEVTVALRHSERIDDETVRYDAQSSLDPTSFKALEAGVLHAIRYEADVVGASATVIGLAATGGGVNPRLFWDAGHAAATRALAAAGVREAEPWMNLTVAVPESTVGRVSGDLARRRGKILGSESRGTLQVLSVEAPLAEMIHYATDLRSLTGGRGSFTMTPSRFRICP